MNEIAIQTNKKQEIKNALALMKLTKPEGNGFIKFLGIVGFMAVVAPLTPLIWPLDLAIAGIGMDQLVDRSHHYVSALKNRFYILRPQTVIREGRLTLDTCSFEDLPADFPKLFEKGKLHKRMTMKEFLEKYNRTIVDFYSSGQSNLFRQLVDAMLLQPLKKRLEAEKVILQPTIIDLYYSFKYDYRQRRDINNFSKGDYRSVMKTITQSVPSEYKDLLHEFTGIDLDAISEDPSEKRPDNLPHASVHKYISRLDESVMSFFIPGYETYQSFPSEGACREFYSLGVNEMVKSAYLSRFALKYLGRYTDENELEFQRFVDIVREAKQDLSDNRILCKIVEYGSVIGKKFEDVEKLLEEYRKNPGKFNTNDKDLLNLKLDSLIQQSKEESESNGGE